jgi:prevent-host-death family protein
MKSVSMLEFRQHADKIVAQLRKGQRLLLTYRGKPVARLEPIAETAEADDPFYSLAGLADTNGASLSNEEIDQIVYGK